jgi:diguanylate cyclase (GGDEF)-like protein
MFTKIDLLRKVDIFSALKNEELSIVAANSEFYAFEKDEIIFKEGDTSDGLYIISSGEVLIQKSIEKEKSIDLARFLQSESFGELDLLENIPMTASAVAVTPSTILIFPSIGTSFEDVIKSHSDISVQILHKMLALIAGRIRSTNRLVSEKSQWIQDLKGQLFYDKLTGLYNRAFFDEDAVSRFRDYKGRSALVILKPDNFKIINDTYGHDGGDKALKLIADCIKSIRRKNDYAIRYRGDEYCIIVPEAEFDEILNIADRLRNSIIHIDCSSITGNDIFHITASFGVAVYPDDEENPCVLLERSYEMMFKARETGGNKIMFYNRTNDGSLV